MIKVIAKRYLQEGTIGAYIECAKPLVDSTRVEAGCIDYGLFYKEDENVAVMMETWESREALAAHSERLKAEGWGDKLNAFKADGKDNVIEILDMVY